MNIDMEAFVTTLGTILAWFMGKQFFLPYIIKFWDWITQKKKDFDEKNVDASKEIVDYKNNTNNMYESQIQFLMEQITSLEAELLSYQEQLEKMRKKILELKSQLYNKALVIGKLQQYCCSNEQCKYRQRCDNMFFCTIQEEK